jgi:opacity protein-like surface antigen
VPYAVGGFGGSFYQFNDRKTAGFDRTIDADGAGWAATVGGGVDWFFADNLALNLEAKQIWHSSLDVTIDGQTFSYDPSDWVATIGFRVFFEENQPRSLTGGLEDNPTRIFLGFRAGGSFLTDDQWAGGVSWEPEAVAWGPFDHSFGGSVGMDFGRHWGFELTADGSEYNAVVDGLGPVSEYVVSPIIPQVRLRLPMANGRWVPFATAGVGVCFGEANDYKPASAGIQFEGEGIYPAFTIGAGMEYFVARNISFAAETRWLYSWNHEFKLNGGEFRGDISEVQVHLALRLYLLEL